MSKRCNFILIRVFYHFMSKALMAGFICGLVFISQVSLSNEINKTNQISQTNNLSYGERINCQKAIEKIYWQYRIWPKENPQSKPAFEQVMSEEALRAKTEDTLRKTNVSCADFMHYKLYGSESFAAPFPAGWSVLSTPADNSFADSLTSGIVVYIVVSVDTCLNESSY